MKIDKTNREFQVIDFKDRNMVDLEQRVDAMERRLSKEFRK